MQSIYNYLLQQQGLYQENAPSPDRVPKELIPEGYVCLILDKQLQLKVALNTESWNYKKRRNEATSINVSVPRNEIRKQLPESGDLYKELASGQTKHLKIAYFVQIWKGDQLKASGKITSRDIQDNVISIEAFTEEILLEKNIVPAQYSKVIQNQDIADIARCCLQGWESKRIKSNSKWNDQTNFLEKHQVEVSNNRVSLAKNGTTYYQNGYIIKRFEKSDYNNFVKWDRIRWVSDNQKPVRTTVQYRYGETDGLSSWSDEIEGSLTDEVGLVPSATNETILDVKINLYTEDTESQDKSGNQVGTTPFVFALEVIAKTEFDLKEGNIPTSTGVTVSDIKADNNNCLKLLADACKQTDYEFKVENKRLSLAESFGQDLTNDVMLRKNQNMDIDNLSDDDEELVNYLFAYGKGDGINRLHLELKDQESINKLGPYPDIKEFETDDYTELQTLAQEYLNKHKTPAQSFSVRAKFGEDEPKYSVGDIVKIVDPDSGIITDIDIVEEKRSYNNDGLSVNLQLGKPQDRLVDATTDTDFQVRTKLLTPSLSISNSVRSVILTANFPTTGEYEATKYYVSTSPDFTPSSLNLYDKTDSKRIEISGLVPGIQYYAKAQNVGKNRKGETIESPVSEEVSFKAAGETIPATLVVAAYNSSDRGKAGADYVCTDYNDQVQINNAINELEGNGGGRVVLLEGIYSLSAGIGMISNSSLIGQGFSTKLKEQKDTYGLGFTNRYDDWENIELSGFQMVSDSLDAGGKYISLENGKSLHLNNIKTQGSTQSPIYLDYVDDFNFKNLEIIDTTAWGIHVKNSTGANIDNCNVIPNIMSSSYTNSHGLLFINVSEGSVVNSKFALCGHRGAEIRGSADLIFENNFFKNNGIENTNVAAHLEADYDSNQNVFRNNTFRWDDAIADPRNAIRIHYGCDNNLITNNDGYNSISDNGNTTYSSAADTTNFGAGNRLNDGSWLVGEG